MITASSRAPGDQVRVGVRWVFTCRPSNSTLPLEPSDPSGGRTRPGQKFYSTRVLMYSVKVLKKVFYIYVHAK